MVGTYTASVYCEKNKGVICPSTAILLAFGDQKEGKGDCCWLPIRMFSKVGCQDHFWPLPNYGLFSCFLVREHEECISFMPSDIKEMADVSIASLWLICRIKRSVTFPINVREKAMGAAVVQTGHWLHTPPVSHAWRQHSC